MKSESAAGFHFIKTTFFILFVVVARATEYFFVCSTHFGNGNDENSVSKCIDNDRNGRTQRRLIFLFIGKKIRLFTLFPLTSWLARVWHCYCSVAKKQHKRNKCRRMNDWNGKRGDRRKMNCKQNEWKEMQIFRQWWNDTPHTGWYA